MSELTDLLINQIGPFNAILQVATLYYIRIVSKRVNRLEEIHIVADGSGGESEYGIERSQQPQTND